MCCHLGLVAHGVGVDVVESTILPQLVDLGNDENCDVRLAAVEAVVHLLPQEPILRISISDDNKF
jgi:serine/threonine-protein phosphatase 4 regulatory subunit 4